MLLSESSVCHPRGLFLPSISLYFGAFIRPCFIPSFIHHALSLLPSVIHTCLSSIFQSFSRVDHAHFWGQPVPRYKPFQRCGCAWALGRVNRYPESFH